MRNPIPSYRRQAGKSGPRAFVELGSRRVCLGRWGSPESRERYQRVLAEWNSSRGDLPATRDTVTVVELLARFWKFAEAYYRRPDGSPTQEVRNYKATLKHIKALYSDLLQIGILDPSIPTPGSSVKLPNEPERSGLRPGSWIRPSEGPTRPFRAEEPAE